MTQTVLLDVADGVATVTLNRPEASNTLDMAMGRELLATALRLEADRGVRAVLLPSTRGSASRTSAYWRMSAGRWRYWASPRSPRCPPRPNCAGGC